MHVCKLFTVLLSESFEYKDYRYWKLAAQCLYNRLIKKAATAIHALFVLISNPAILRNYERKNFDVVLRVNRCGAQQDLVY